MNIISGRWRSLSNGLTRVKPSLPKPRSYLRLDVLGSLPEAAESYRQALTLYRELGQLHFAREALAGLSRVALAQGDLAQAQALVAELLPQLTIENLYGAREPFRVYLTCYQVLQASHDPRATEVLVTAHHLLQQRAAAIEDERLRRSFLENVPAHRDLVQAFTQQAVSHSQPVQLA